MSEVDVQELVKLQGDLGCWVVKYSRFGNTAQVRTLAFHVLHAYAAILLRLMADAERQVRVDPLPYEEIARG